jgi:phosphatidylglycerophosphate synthase
VRENPITPGSAQPQPDARVAYQLLGTCRQKIWGRDVAALLEQVLLQAGLEPLPEDEGSFSQEDAIAIFRVDYFFDRSAVKLLLASPGSAIVEWQDSGTARPLAVLCAARDADRWRALILGEPRSKQDLPQGVELIDAANPPTIFEDQLRKRSHPLILAANEATRDQIENRTFELAYKGVTDIVTKHVFPRPAFYATQLAARLGVTPNMVTTASLVLVFAVLDLFAENHLALGLCLGFAMSFLDTVDGKLARVTQTSSTFGNYFDHIIDMVHPPLWWIAWWWGVGNGLDSQPDWWNAAGIATFAGYIALRLLEWDFIATFGVRIHTWRRWDSRFRLISSRRNPNLILLTAATLCGRPDLGLAAVALWTLGCLAIHGVRWMQAWFEVRRGEPLSSWLEETSSR